MILHTNTNLLCMRYAIWLVLFEFVFQSTIPVQLGRVIMCKENRRTAQYTRIDGISVLKRMHFVANTTNCQHARTNAHVCTLPECECLALMCVFVCVHMCRCPGVCVCVY